MLDIYREHNFGSPGRIETRLEKFTQIAEGNIILSHKVYTLSYDAIDLLSKECVDPTLYYECSGCMLEYIRLLQSSGRGGYSRNYRDCYQSSN